MKRKKNELIEILMYFFVQINGFVTIGALFPNDPLTSQIIHNNLTTFLKITLEELLKFSTLDEILQSTKNPDLEIAKIWNKKAEELLKENQELMKSLTEVKKTREESAYFS